MNWDFLDPVYLRKSGGFVGVNEKRTVYMADLSEEDAEFVRRETRNETGKGKAPPCCDQFHYTVTYKGRTATIEDADFIERVFNK